MLIHTVFFWLKPDTTPEQAETFKQNVRNLKSIPTIESIYVGTPAPTNRPVIDSSYAVCLTVIFKDLAAHDVYQSHPDHLAFVDANNSLWAKVLVYDAVE